MGISSVADQMHKGIINTVQIGIDIGQAVDPTAICVAQCDERPSGRKEPTESLGVFRDIQETIYNARFLRRLPLGLPYAAIADQLAAILSNERLAGDWLHVSAWVDYTGVGRAVYEQIATRMKDRAPRVILHPVTFVHGEKYNPATGSLGKAHLVSTLQAHFNWGRIALDPRSPEAAATKDELQAYRINVDQDGRDTYGAKIGAHDDLATALGLATLVDPRSYIVTYGQQLF